jgi:hypothetical protein
MEHKGPSFSSYLSPNPHSPNSQLSHQLIESIAEMADIVIPKFPKHPRIPILNSGLYTIQNVENGAIRIEDGSVAAVGNSGADEVVVSRDPYESPLYILSDITMDCSGKSLGTRIPRTPSPPSPVSAPAPSHLVIQPILEMLIAKTPIYSTSVSTTQRRQPTGSSSQSSQAPTLQFRLCTYQM